VVSGGVLRLEKYPELVGFIEMVEAEFGEVTGTVKVK